MTIYLLTFALAVLGPYAVTAWYVNRAKVVFQGTVPISTFALTSTQALAGIRKTKSEPLPVRMPDGQTLWVEVGLSRLQSLPENIKQVAITVKKPLLGGRYIESLRFPGEEVELPGDTTRSGARLAVFYYGIAFGFFYWLTGGAQAMLLGCVGIFCPMVLSFLAGWLFGQATVPVEYSVGKSYGRLVTSRAQRLSFWLLALPMALMSALALLYTGGSSGQLVIAFIGLNASLALGGLLGLLFKPAVQQFKQTPVEKSA